MNVLQLIKDNREAIALFYSGDNFAKFEQDKHLLLLILLVSLSRCLSFGLAFHGLLYFYLNTVLIYEPYGCIPKFEN